MKHKGAIGSGFPKNLSAATLTAVAISMPAGGLLAQGASELNVQIQGGSEGKGFAKIIEMFNETHPDVTVNLQLLTGEQKTGTNLAVIGSNNAPDIAVVPLNTQVYTQALNANALMPLTDLYQNTNLDDRVGKSIVSSFYVDGTPYIVPYLTNFYNVIYANVDMFNEAGIEFPADHRIESIDQLIDWTNKFEENGHAALAIGGASGYLVSWMVDAFLPTITDEATHTNFLQSFDPNIEVTARYDGPEFTMVIETLDRLNKAGFYQNGFLAMKGDASVTEWIVGNAALALGGNFDMPLIRGGEPNFEYDWLVLPSLGVNPGRLNLYYGDAMAIPRNAKQPELAQEFLELMLSDRGQAAFLEIGLLPTVNSLSDDQLASIDPMIKAMLNDIGTNGGVVGWTSAVPGGLGQQFIEPLLQNMYVDSTTPQEIAKKLQQRLVDFRAGRY
ncbi:ABC transporter substrate-binding protein [Mameliella alba]|uniref:sn-glycerol-3-phosphate-binding periplasmic protein UgpB n=1 Tax=Mameliella alba TaxID=561184 RepID=A0A0B3RY98_9RHOB|nr:extracellular solute-binding protein [Mameliella alba]KHQ51718.1 ABC transporter, substrate-binding protein [Mameliella alba]